MGEVGGRVVLRHQRLYPLILRARLKMQAMKSGTFACSSCPAPRRVVTPLQELGLLHLRAILGAGATPGLHSSDISSPASSVQVCRLHLYSPGPATSDPPLINGHRLVAPAGLFGAKSRSGLIEPGPWPALGHAFALLRNSRRRVQHHQPTPVSLFVHVGREGREAHGIPILRLPLNTLDSNNPPHVLREMDLRFLHRY
jgi:hypothetical protein